MADAAYQILNSDAKQLSGETLIDEDILRQAGETDFSQYLHDPECTDLFPDLFID
jgi:citronellol/citronellal dehydrogenase